MKNNKEIRFVSILDDTTFKFLWKKENSRKWFSKLIKLITNINLDEYELYNPEINSGNDLKDYTLDILFIKKDYNKSVNIEMYNKNTHTNHIKSGQYAFKLLGDRMKKGDIYHEHNLIQINFYNSTFKDNEGMNIMCYQAKDETNKHVLNYLKIYDVYLFNYKGICYNGDNELEAMLSFMTGESYEELRRIANGNKEELGIVKDLEDLAMEEKYWGVYDRNKENSIMQNSLYEEGKNEGTMNKSIEIAKIMLKNNEEIEKISQYTGLSIEKINNLII